MKITLSDIAKATGVTASTVQRALNNREGVSEAKRKEIQKKAAEMGYIRNYAASSLRKGKLNIAVVLPETTGDNRFYAKYIWNGIENYLEENRTQNINLIKYPYEWTAENQARELESLLLSEERIDGVITLGINEPAVLKSLELLGDNSIPAVFLSADLKSPARLGCVKAYDEMAGSCAADLMLKFCTFKDTDWIILTGDFTIPDQFYNAQGFEKQIYNSGANLNILKVTNEKDLNVVKEKIKDAIKGNNIFAIYSTSARNTVAMCRAVSECGNVGEIKLIGSDLFPENIKFIQGGILSASVHKRHATQSYTAMKMLVNYLINNEELENDVVFIRPSIVIESNIECFISQ